MATDYGAVLPRRRDAGLAPGVGNRSMEKSIMSDLVERLRRAADDAALIAMPCAGEAADRIEALEQDIAASEHNFQTMRQRRNEAVDRIEALEAALRQIEERLLALNTRWAADGGPFDGGWVSEVMDDIARAALAPEPDK